MGRICKLAETNRLLTPDDLDEIIDNVARDPEGLAVIEGSDGTCLQFIKGEQDGFHVESLVDAKPRVQPGNADMTTDQLRSLLRGYIEGQPMEALTSGWVEYACACKSRSFADYLPTILFVLFIAYLAYLTVREIYSDPCP